MSSLPKLYTAEEFRHLLGWGVDKLRRARLEGRISPPPQLVGGFVWVYSGDAKIMRKGMDMSDPFVASLPPEFISEEVMKDESRVPPKVERSGTKGSLPKMVRLWNFDNMTRGMGVRRIEELTGVHHNTLDRIKDGKKVTAKVALKLARGLEIPVESLIRR